MKIYSDVILGGNLQYPNIIGSYSFNRNIQGKVNESVSVLDFGAKGDGIVDDTIALNRAIDNLVSKGGGQLVFPPGTYNISNQIGKKYTGIGSNHVSLEIIGVDATIIATSNIYSYGLYISGDFTTISIKDMVIDGDNKLTSGLVIDGSGATSIDILDHNAETIIIDNCKVYNLMGLTQSRAEVSGIKISNAVNATIHNCKVENLSRWSWLTKKEHALSWKNQSQPAYWIDVSGISAVDCDRLSLTDCIVKDISHGNSRNMNPEDPKSPFPNQCIPGGTQGTFGTPIGSGTSKYLRIYDSNGIRVYNGRDTTNRSRYLRQQSIITNNTLIDCDNRFIKLQTNGQCIVDNNILYLGQDPNKPANPLCGYQWEGHPFFGATSGYPGVRVSSLALMIDSQIANVKITNNKFYIDDYLVGNKNALFDNYEADEVGLTPSVYMGHTYSNEWPYGIKSPYNDDTFSPSVVMFQTPTSATIFEPYESYFSNYENNEFYTTKLWRNGIQMQPPRLGSTASVFTTIKNNIHSTNSLFSNTSLNSREDVAHTYFLRATVPYGPTAASGQWILDVSDNKIFSYEYTYFSLGGTYSYMAPNGSALTDDQLAQLPRDYSKNWNWLFYDNFRYPQAGNNEVIRSGGNGLVGASGSLTPFTSNMLIRNNVMGDVEGFISLPFDLKKIVDGSDFSLGGNGYFYNVSITGVDNRPKNMPFDDKYSYNVGNLNSRIYKNGNFTYVDGSYRLYRTRNCVTWEYMSYAHATASNSATFSSQLIV